RNLPCSAELGNAQWIDTRTFGPSQALYREQMIAVLPFGGPKLIQLTLPHRQQNRQEVGLLYAAGARARGGSHSLPPVRYGRGQLLSGGLILLELLYLGRNARIGRGGRGGGGGGG